jgi:hypothetical protein
MAAKLKQTGFKKRQLITDASRTMFLWIAVASVAVSICIVLSQFLFVRWQYNNKLIGAKSRAANTLQTNITNAQSLKAAISNLAADQNLASVKTNPGDPNTKGVLDALPTTADSAALATSLQRAIMSPSGVTIDNISVPTTSLSSTQGASTAPATTSLQAASPQQMKFSVTVTGSYDQIHNLILDFERTIRPIQIIDFTMTGTDASLQANIDAVTYYQPPTSVSIIKQAVK